MIPSVWIEDQPGLIAAIATLHNGGQRFAADLTYGHGSFWKKDTASRPYRPRIRGDLDDTLPNLTHPGLDVTRLARSQYGDAPFDDESLASIVFDPPFIHAAGKDSIMGQRFGSYPSQVALRQMYWQAIMQFQRVLAPRGLLVWKAQDIVESGKQNWNHVDIMMNARSCGMPVIDLFVLVRRSAIQGHNHANQKHARRTHSYFLVARKGGEKR